MKDIISIVISIIVIIISTVMITLMFADEGKYRLICRVCSVLVLIIAVINYIWILKFTRKEQGENGETNG